MILKNDKMIPMYCTMIKNRAGEIVADTYFESDDHEQVSAYCHFLERDYKVSTLDENRETLPFRVEMHHRVDDRILAEVRAMQSA